MTKPIPEGYHTVTAHVVVANAREAIAFYKAAFGAKERSVAPGPDGRVMHAEVQIGSSILMLSDAFPEFGQPAPAADANLPVTLHLYVEDADAMWAQALRAGATVTMPLEDAFWGDRYGKVRDPFGHSWAIATHKEDLSMGQIDQRMKDSMKDFPKS